jgi:hypothetical protein
MNEALIEEVSAFLDLEDTCQWAGTDHHTLAALAFWIDFDLEDFLETRGSDYWSSSRLQEDWAIPAIALPDSALTH